MKHQIQRTEGGWQRAEGGGQRSEGRDQRAGGNISVFQCFSISVFAFLLSACGCAQAESPKPSAGDTLLLRVQFAGTTALMANTNAAYLTNFAALPETAALGTQLVARIASLPVRLVGSGGQRAEGGGRRTEDRGRKAELEAVFGELLGAGFTLELRGTATGVTDFAVAAKGTDETLTRWEKIWQQAGSGFLTARKNGHLCVAGGGTEAAVALAEIQKTIAGSGLEAGNVLQAELASSLVPGPIQRSVYGGFSRLKLSVAPSDQSLKIRGTAAYAQDLPKLGAPPVIPADLVTEPAISFTLVREPGAWLEAKSVLRRFLPDPVPDTAFFWGGESSPYQLVMIIPFAGREAFNGTFGPALVEQLQALAKFMDTGTVVLDTNRAGIQWQGVPFIGPQVTVKNSGTNSYLVAEIFPPNDFPPGLTPALIERVSGRTNLLIYDWEFTKLRMDTWLRIGQFALFSSGHQQLGSDIPSLKWIVASITNLSNGGNTSTEITQTGPRELSLNRRAPLAFTSIELFWLANWLESTNFPAANFLMPAAQ